MTRILGIALTVVAFMTFIAAVSYRAGIDAAIHAHAHCTKATNRRIAQTED